MARLWVISDLHLESVPYPTAFAPRRPRFDILVVAGDTWRSDVCAGFSAMARLADGRPVVAVLGNHEHWGGIVQETAAKARAAASSLGVTLLENGVASVHGVRFAGGTLWTDRRIGQDQPDADPIGEEISVRTPAGTRRMTVGDGRVLHGRALAAIRDAMEADGDGPLVGVTHHAPLAECVGRTVTDWAAAHSASDLSALVDSGKARLWVHGHVHRCVDLERPGGTRVLCNPAGAMFANPGFDEGLVVEV